MKPLPRNNFQKFSVIKSLYTNIKEKPLLVWLSRQEMSYISQSQPDSSALWLICGLKINHFVIYNGTFISPPRAVILYHLTSQWLQTHVVLPKNGRSIFKKPRKKKKEPHKCTWIKWVWGTVWNGASAHMWHGKFLRKWAAKWEVKIDNVFSPIWFSEGKPVWE